MDQATKQRLRSNLQGQISTRLSIAEGPANDDSVKTMIAEEVVASTVALPSIDDEERANLIQTFTNEFLYFGPLQPFLVDPTITEIMVQGQGFDAQGNMLPHRAYVERDGVIEPCPDLVFEDEAHVVRIMNRICARQGRHIDDANPIEDATLPDGSRFNGTLFPLCPDGSTFNIRRFKRDMLTAEDLVAAGTASPQMVDFLVSCVRARCSILISGGTGSGKTTLLNILGQSIPAAERIITIEDTCELLIKETHDNVVRLEERKPNSEGTGGVTLDQHLRSALRKRPDRIIVGECRGPEAYTMLEAMNTGHDGSMTTIHANDSVSALTRLMTLAKQGDATLSESTIRSKMASALDLVVQVQRMTNGTRRIIAIEALGDHVDGCIQHETLFSFENDGYADGDIVGRYMGYLSRPKKICEKFRAAGIAFDSSWFTNEEWSPQ